ncbi:histidine phosphatase family protein [Rhodoplanes elegans]|uniref:Histidine phosphatase family protein n=1 Tax=Rhodoplanes elegans TaxID=29408 RepID=A0A327KWF1_9BRAD|nr:histidine phosphatase family protein [Rhodoplanes elegans]MBK5957712.1 histidine phosphatase family protein [Rhodoplanes elegans]RAI41552.1 histidine phosphatase family protein [Rhodoplanes elegans]
MTTTFFLVRHAPHGLQDRVLVGRTPRIGLSDEGRRQAAALAVRLSTEALTSVHASPRERAQQTANPIAEAARVVVTISPDLDEIDFGIWTGRGVVEMADDPTWRRWNENREHARAPDGESMQEVQQRAVGLLDRLARTHPDGRIAAVSHGDVIRAALLHYLGMRLDAYDRLEVSPASVSTLVVGAWGARLLSLNEQVKT